MKLQEKVRWICHILDTLFPSPIPPLLHKDTYTLLIAVLLSARATDAKVNELTPLLFEKADTPGKMILLPLSEIEKIIRPIGFYKTKARAIWGLSQILLEKYGGKVPASFEALESLPGVGHKTASVVMAQGFQIPAFPIDTHMERCAKRWGLSQGKTVQRIERDLKLLFPKSEWIRKHLQIIYFARKYCQARVHSIPLCPICNQLFLEEKA